MSLPFKSRDTAALQDHTVYGGADGKNLYRMQFNFQVVYIYQIFLTPNGTRWSNSSFRRFSLGDLEIMARNYFKHKVNGCELKSSRGCVFSCPSLLPLPRRRREGESGLPTIASFLRSVWLVMVLGNHGLYCVFLACVGETQTQISPNLSPQSRTLRITH